MVYLYGALHCPSWGPVLRGLSLKFSRSRKIRHWSPFCWNTWYFGWVPYYSHKMGMCYRIMPKRSCEICLFFLWFGGRSAWCRSFKIHFWVVVFALGKRLGFCVTELLTMLEFSMPCDWESLCCMSSVVCACHSSVLRIAKAATSMLLFWYPVLSVQMLWWSCGNKVFEVSWGLAAARMHRKQEGEERWLLEHAGEMWIWGM